MLITRKTIFILIASLTAVSIIYVVSGKPLNISETMIAHGEALPAECYAWSGDSDKCSFFRVITLEGDLFDYRKPDYNGGFYLRFQLGVGTEDDSTKQVSFDEVNNPPKNYIAHFGASGTTDIGGGFQMPNFNIWYIQLHQPFDPDTFDFNNPQLEWLSYDEGWARGILPDPMLLFSRLNIYTSKMKDNLFDAEAYRQEQIDRMEQIKLAGNERCDMALIKQLKQEGKYDTIISREDSMLYINTDMEYYEQSTAPDIFYITYKKFHPNGVIRERRQFLPGIYVSNCMPIGINAYYDEAGTLTDINYPEMQIFPFPQMATVVYIIRLLEYEGWIDRKTGKGKAVMKINHHINPHEPSHGEQRLMIRSTWQIQASDDLNSTVGVLVTNDGAETAYIIDKNSRTILKKFKR